MKFSSLVLVFLVAVISCGPGIQHPRVHKSADTPQCADACKHLQDLKCDEGRDLPDGTTCQTFCEKTQNSGHALHPSCVLRIHKCEELDNLEAFCPTMAE